MSDRGTTKSWALVAIPAGFVTTILPVVAPAGTVVRIWELLSIVYWDETPPKVTSLVPMKPLPERVTCVPARPFDGVKEAMEGDVKTVKLVALDAVP